MSSLLSVEVRKSRSSRVEMVLFGMYEIAKVLTTPLHLETALGSVLRLLSSFLDMSDGLIVLLDEQSQPELAVGADWRDTSVDQLFGRIPERAFGQLVTTRMPLVVENIGTDPLFAGSASAHGRQGEQIRSFIGVPIKDRDLVIGTLSILRDSADSSGFGLDTDVRFLTMIASLIGQTVRLHRLLAHDRDRLISERTRLEKALEAQSGTERRHVEVAGIVGDSPAIRAVLETIKIVARSKTTVLLRGDSGTGKELFARALHDLSPRKDKAFVSVNCAALPESVLESELFGHEKGSFTGAVAQRKGRFELADGGTLFLDEIGEISPFFQAKLLRVLQESSFERVGGARTLTVDVRVVVATNRNLEEAVAKGTFRADLYYRINVVPIFLPALRERSSDIPALAREFLRRFNEEHDTSLEMTDSAFAVLGACSFPGNVRELENCVRRAATLARHTRISGDDLACRNDQCLSAMLWKETPPKMAGYVPLPVGNGSSCPPSCPPACHTKIGDEEPRLDRERLMEAMETAGWVQAKAARLLGMTPRQIGYALKKHDIPLKRF